ncbi:helix-turn-helix domain-containing protein [Deinococcus koreensis]|nr:helix-turn-helix domain-containing protein [Deinococcus koreensis]
MNERLALERQELVRAWHSYVTRQGPVPSGLHVRPAGAAPPPSAHPAESAPSTESTPARDSLQAGAAATLTRPAAIATIDQEVAASWARSALTVSPERASAPVVDEAEVRQAWKESPLEFGVRGLIPELRRLAEDADLVVALGDPNGTLLWTQGSARMAGLASSINFVPGGQWGEGSVGTNALALALRTRQAVRVFSAEHYVQTVHDWVCYSSPIRDTQTGALLGVLDFSTTWECSTPLGLASARHYAQQIELALSHRALPASQLRLRFCGAPRVQYAGRSLHLTPRQHELLCVLALHPGGLTLDALHAHVYGDQPISLSTLKSEVSTLRALLGGQIASRPYRLSIPMQLDIQDIEEHLLAGRVSDAADLYDGPLLPHSSSPLLSYWRDYLDAALREAVCRSRDPELLWRYASRFDDPECLEVLEGLLAPDDHRLPIARARRAALDASF